jgi:aminopeptidase N
MAFTIKIKYLVGFCMLFLVFHIINCGMNKSDERIQARNDTLSSDSTFVLKEPPPTEEDPHSYSNPHDVQISHMELDLEVNFKERQLAGMVKLHIDNKRQETKLYLDTRDLSIDSVTLGKNEEKATFTLGNKRKYLGQALVVNIKPETELVNIYYSTSPQAAALLWLDSTQTAGGKKPFLFTQSQAILARTWIPCQDCPCVRMTYRATIKTEPGLLAIMSAENPTRKTKNGSYTFEMKQPIPSYLLALAVGDLRFQALGERSGVYAEPSMLNAAVKEFEDTEKMILAAESLYGPYRWERYDIIVLPPSFPFGGMENPRLTFVTPTVIAGDKSLTTLIAHELAHSWSGNLVTNTTWNDFWLNEGFTTYFERRSMEEVYGKDYSEMIAQLGFQDLQEKLEELKRKQNDTKLKLDLKGRDPDDGMTDIAYEKGYFFLRMLEESFERPEWDDFLRHYFDELAFQSVTSEMFIHRLKKYFSTNGKKSVVDSLNIDEWVYSPGLPENCPKVESSQFLIVEEQIKEWESGTPARKLETEGWTTHHWLHFLRNLP